MASALNATFVAEFPSAPTQIYTLLQHLTYILALTLTYVSYIFGKSSLTEAGVIQFDVTLTSGFQDFVAVC